MRRLSIVDIAGGDQPKISPDGNVVVIFNGEIYNHVELRKTLEAEGVEFSSGHSDTEVILKLFMQRGPEFVHELDGMFAIAIYDARVERLHLYRDRIGERPLYFVSDAANGEFAFASEFATLEYFSAKKIDYRALAWFFSQKATPADASIDVKIRKLRPGHRLTVERSGSVTEERYYRRPSTIRAIGTEEAEIARLDELLQHSVSLRMRADVEVGAFLSGGIDSSLVVAMAAKLSPTPLKTFCLVYDEPIYEKASDRKYARVVSDLYRTSHTEVRLTPDLLIAELPKIVRAFGQPNSAVIANWFISKEMSKAVSVSLSGDGADEMFGSYFLHRVAAAMDSRQANDGRFDAFGEAEQAKALQSAPEDLPLWVDAAAVFPDVELQKLLVPSIYERQLILKMLRQRAADLPAGSCLERVLAFDLQGLLVEQVLNYVDVLGLGHSLEIRVPFLDHALVEHAMSIPGDLKIRGHQTKYILKKLAERYLPHDLVHRKKEGFVEPAVYWLGSELKDFCQQRLFGSAFNRLKLLDGRYVKGLVENFYQNKDFALGKKVWCLLMFAEWERTYAGS